MTLLPWPLWRGDLWDWNLAAVIFLGVLLAQVVKHVLIELHRLHYWHFLLDLKLSDVVEKVLLQGIFVLAIIDE